MIDQVPWLVPAILVGGTLVSYGLTGRVLAILRRRAILDHPNARSSHDRPTPRGGGWGIVLTVLPAWLLIFGAAAELIVGLPLLGGIVALAVVSWRDDLSGLSAGVRFGVQVCAVVAGLATLPADSTVFQGWLPPLADRALAAVAWLWFVNLFNFMDGIDGLAGAETASIGGGVALVVAAAGLPPATALLALATAAAALGFLVWNWQPAKVFLGDVGSVPLGYLLGWLLLGLAAAGQWVPALLLPLYFLADATLTLLRRLLRGVRVWEAHREHFYQKAVQAGRRHADVVRAVLVANLVLIVCAVLAVDAGPLLLVPGAATVALLMVWLAHGKEGA